MPLPKAPSNLSLFVTIILRQVLYCTSELLSPQQFLDETQAAGKAMPA
jgi:hypothetical protein